MAEARPLGGPGYGLVERVRDSIRRHGMLSGGEKVVVATSGGPDSACLLDALARLQETFDLDVEVAHVDHALNPDSAQVAARVARRAASYGFEVHLTAAPDLSGKNLQARARAFRYAFFDAVCKGTDADRLATGHTLDDRVETTLARLLHGGATDVLAGIPPFEGNRIRPLIDVRRAETRAYCDELGLYFYDDPANEDDRFERVALRKRVVSAVEGRWGDGGVRAIAGSAERLLEDSRALRGLGDRLYEEMAESRGDEVSFALEGVLAVPRALRRRLLEKAVGRIRNRHGGIEAALDALERPPPGGEKRYAVASGVEIAIDPARILVRRARGPRT